MDTIHTENPVAMVLRLQHRAPSSPRGEGTGHSLGTGDVPPTRVCFHSFWLGRVVYISAPTPWQRVCFDTWKGPAFFSWDGCLACYHTPVGKVDLRA